MSAIISPASFFAAKLYFPKSDSTHFNSVTRPHRNRSNNLRLCSRLNSSRSSGPVSPDNGGDMHYGLPYGFIPRKGWPVFVTLPIDVLGDEGKMKRKKAMVQSFRALTAGGVEGVVMEVWWGVVENVEPGVYNWEGYLEIVDMAKKYGLKVRAVMAFHQCGSRPEDPYWIPLPQWVLEEINRDPDIAYSDGFGRSTEYISVGCDYLPVLRGRSPIQVYADFMRNFRDTFRPLFDTTITGIRVGMGPAGELRFPLYPPQKLTWAWRSRDLGEFQFYDKYTLASLNACARDIGLREWGSGGLIGANSLTRNFDVTELFKSSEGFRKTQHGDFFLEWYSSMMLLHGERICREAETIFRGTGVIISAKVTGTHWRNITQSRPSEVIAGYYNTLTRDTFLPVARMFGRYGFSLCCNYFELRDEDDKKNINLIGSSESLLEQLLNAVRICNLPVEGENTATRLDDDSYEQVIRTSKLYSSRVDRPSFSFNLVRMDKNLFEHQNWVSFTRFVRQMSNTNIFRARLDIGCSNMLHLSTSHRCSARIGLTMASSMKS